MLISMVQLGSLLSFQGINVQGAFLCLFESLKKISVPIGSVC